ncbi:hypothetical protein ACHAW6_002904 [Cyclotella cf. meneghiniana]
MILTIDGGKYAVVLKTSNLQPIKAQWMPGPPVTLELRYQHNTSMVQEELISFHPLLMMQRDFTSHLKNHSKSLEKLCHVKSAMRAVGYFEVSWAASMLEEVSAMTNVCRAD